MIGFGAVTMSGFGSISRLQVMEYNHIDYVRCNDLYDGDIVDSMLCAGVPDDGEES